MSEKKQCITCSKSGGIMTCDGCQQTFCGKHVVEHRQQLANQLDGIMQEHDLLQQELGRTSHDNTLLKKIDKWEKESITMIQVAAEAARADLRETLDRSKRQISKACRDIAENLRASREAEDFSEIDLTRWIKQLKELKLEIESPSLVKLIEDKISVIHLIPIQDYNFENKELTKNKNDSPLKSLPVFNTQERFSKVIGRAILNKEGLVAKSNGYGLHFAYVLGQELYSEGRQTIPFQIEQSKTPYNIFFGCISSQVNPTEISFRSSFTVGWFGGDEVRQHGSCNINSNLHGYESDKIATNDVLHLTFDCERKQIELFHERQNKRHTLPVDIAKAPFPWQLLLAFNRLNDSVRILSEQ